MSALCRTFGVSALVGRMMASANGRADRIIGICPIACNDDRWHRRTVETAGSSLGTRAASLWYMSVIGNLGAAIFAASGRARVPRACPKAFGEGMSERGDLRVTEPVRDLADRQIASCQHGPR